MGIESEGKDEWLSKAQHAYEQSTTFVDANYRSKWDAGLSHFQSRHAAGSKYLKSAYKYRTKIFRPKTRATIRNNEAAAVAAFFGNADVVSVTPQNEENDIEKASADLYHEVLNYRLTNTIPWFLTCVGGFQDGMVMGVMVSHQFWGYEEDSDGNILKDEPCIDLLPIETIRIHPAADWRDPINTSPYLIRLIPMYVSDIRARMKTNDPKTNEPKWKTFTDGQIKSAQKELSDRTTQIRDNDREDKFDKTSAVIQDYDVVWVRQYFMKDGRIDKMFYTLGGEYRLSDPVDTRGLYPGGKRPFVMGAVILETHRIMPSSLAELGRPLQQELNENVCQRGDNIKLALNKRFIVARGSNPDLKALLRNVPGSVIQSDSTEDIKPLEVPDITSSSYAEQDRHNVDFDEITGNFSQSTVQTNKNLNETVGGLSMLRSGSNALTEYLIRMFSETWVEPVIQQLLKLEQAYETDMVILTLASKKAGIALKYGQSEITDELLDQQLTAKVNVGTSATDPWLGFERLMAAVGAVTNLSQQQSQQLTKGINVREIQKEIMSAVGDKNGDRFLETEDQEIPPEIVQMQQQMEQMGQAMQEMQAALQDGEADRQNKLEIQAMKEKGQTGRTIADNETDLQVEQIKIVGRQ